MAQYIAKEIKCASVRSAEPDVSGWAETNKCCRIGAEKKFGRTYLDFDFSGMPIDAEVTSAYLYLFPTGAHSNYWDQIYSYKESKIFKVDSSWEENVTWNNMPDMSSEIVFEFKISGVMTTDITSIVQEWILNPNSMNGICLRSYEWMAYYDQYIDIYNHYSDNPDFIPYIEINYVGQQMYKVSENRLRAIANEVRRITDTTDTMTIDDMLNNLSNININANIDLIIDGTLIELNNDTVTSIAPHKFRSDKNIQTVNCPNVTTIGTYAFYGCTNLNDVSVDKATSIEDNAFDSSKISGDIVLPELTTLGSRAFGSCDSLSSFSAPKVTKLNSYAFYHCDNLTSVNIPEATTIDAESFNYCNSLESVDFPKVTSIGRAAFNHCISLTSVNLPLLSSMNIQGFSDCTALEKLDLPKITKTTNQSFSGCTSLTALIFRSETMVTLYGSTTLTDTPIASGTGYIYVPSALIDTYKADSKWATYANQFRAIEDYPDICG